MSNFQKTRQVVLAKADYHCEVCGTSHDRLHVHHKDFERIDHSVKNLQVLCPQCHKDIHRPRMYGRSAEWLTYRKLAFEELSRIHGRGCPWGFDEKQAKQEVSKMADVIRSHMREEGDPCSQD